jgi:HSP20 family protein
MTQQQQQQWQQRQQQSQQRGRGFYDPLSEINRLVNQVFVGGLARRPATEQQQQQGDGGQTTAWAPNIDVLQRDNDLVIRVELPGVEPDEVDVTIQNNVLTISGIVREEREEERQGYLVRERRTGGFRRSLQLPQEVDESAVAARFDNGVLEIILEGAATTQEPTRVQVESGNGSRSQQSNGGGQQSGGGQ